MLGFWNIDQATGAASQREATTIAILTGRQGLRSYSGSAPGAATPSNAVSPRRNGSGELGGNNSS